MPCEFYCWDKHGSQEASSTFLDVLRRQEHQSAHFDEMNFCNSRKSARTARRPREVAAKAGGGGAQAARRLCPSASRNNHIHGHVSSLIHIITPTSPQDNDELRYTTTKVKLECVIASVCLAASAMVPTHS